MGEWINVKDRLPEPGEWVLVYHDYRLSEYGTPIALGQWLRFHGSQNGAWVWVAGKCHLENPKQRNSPMEWINAHTMKPGNNHVSHWMPLPDKPQPIERTEAQE